MNLTNLCRAALVPKTCSSPGLVMQVVLIASIQARKRWTSNGDVFGAQPRETRPAAKVAFEAQALSKRDSDEK